MRIRALLASLAVLLAWGCADQNVVAPTSDAEFPILSQFAVLDGAHGGNENFFFLPPLVKNPNATGTFNPNLLPTMDVCLITAATLADEVCDVPVVHFGPGSAAVSTSNYAFSWDTDGPETSPLLTRPDDNTENYRIYISSANKVLGYLDVNPQDPSGNTPGQDTEGLYAFRNGEVLPVKFFIGLEENCTDVSGYVIQCAASGIVDESGATITLEPEQPGWSRLSVFVPPYALPNCDPLDPNDPDCQVVMTIERIDPALFTELTLGEHCIPGIGYGVGSSFDAPLFGDCFRVTTEPQLKDELEQLALVEMCINLGDPNAYPGLKFDEEQDTRLQIIAFHDRTPAVEGLVNAYSTTCGEPVLPSPSQLGLLPVPENGLLRYAAIGVNSVARWLAPTPLSAHGEIRLAGATGEFSNFMWGLPGQMTKEAGDGTVIQPLAGDDYDVTVKVKVVDSGVNLTPSAIEGATVHFSGPGALSAAAVVTGADGIAEVTWTVPAEAGDYTLEATALGLLASPVPDHDKATPFTEATVTFTATVVGAPASVATTGTLPGNDATVGSEWPDIGVVVKDSRTVVITGASVTWTVTSPPCPAGAAACAPGTWEDNGDGTGTWTLGTFPGVNTLTATVGGTAPPVTTRIEVTTVADLPHHVVIDPIAAPVVGKPYTMTGRAQDQYNNNLVDALSWAVSAGGGSVAGASWTLGTLAGALNTITASVTAYPAVTASYSVNPAADVPDKVVKVSGDGQTGPINTDLANPLVVQVTDKWGNLLTSQTVSWTANGGSSVTASTPYTWTLGPTPNFTYQATASVGGSQNAVFTATAMCKPTINGEMGANEWACAESAEFDANISGGTVKARVYWMNDATNLYMMVRVPQASADKANSLRIDFDNNANGAGDQYPGTAELNDDIIGFNSGGGGFYDWYLTAKCVNSSQSGCGAVDAASNGEGAMGNAANVTTYELSHPLGNAANAQDFFRSKDQDLGFFLSLQSGKGAQGNTQWPGFRFYRKIRIQ